jgi:hypothetical protein
MISSPNHQLIIPKGLQYDSHEVMGSFMAITYRSTVPRTVTTPGKGFLLIVEYWNQLIIYYDGMGHECFRADDRYTKSWREEQPLNWIKAFWRKLKLWV